MPDITKLKENTKNFINNATIAGLVNASVSKNVEVRVAWVLVILTSLGLCGYMIYCNYAIYLAYESKTTIQEIIESNSKFPTVVICNRNTFTNEFSYQYLSNYSSNSNNSFKDNQEFLYKAYANYLYNIKHKEEIKYIDYQIDDILLTCQFNQINCDGTFFQWFYHNIYRNCYMFNSNSSFDSFAPGKGRGLTMELFAGVHDKLDMYSDAKGFSVIILNNTSLNATNMDGLFISTGKETNIVVKRNFNYRLPKPYSNCDIKEINPDSFKSDLYGILINKSGTYTNQDCMELCFQYFVYKECNCFDHESFWYFDDVQVCHTDDQIKCVDKIHRNISSSMILNEKCYPWCPVECDIVYFSSTISTSPYPPNNFYLNELRDDDKIITKYSNISLISDQKLKQSVLKVSIYYDSLSYSVVSQSPTMTIVDLLASLGGVLGLFLGMSLISFVEIIELFIQLICNIFKKSETKKKQIK